MHTQQKCSYIRYGAVNVVHTDGVGSIVAVKQWWHQPFSERRKLCVFTVGSWRSKSFCSVFSCLLFCTKINPFLLLENFFTQSNSTLTVKKQPPFFFICPLQLFAAAKGDFESWEKLFSVVLLYLSSSSPSTRLFGRRALQRQPRGSWEKRPSPPQQKTNGRLPLHSLGRPQDVTDDEVWLWRAA